MHNKVCVRDASHLGLGERSKYNHACLTPSVLLGRMQLNFLSCYCGEIPEYLSPPELNM